MRKSFLHDESGTTMVEMAIVATLLFVLVLGFVDFGYAFYQWNAGNKAVQVGARFAAVSGPVVDQLPTITDVPPDVAEVGSTVAAGLYDYVCDGGTSSCSCSGTGGAGDPCSGGATFDQAAFDYIFGKMQAFFPRLQKSNVRIEYVATGLGYWTRPGGPVPTIRVSLRNLKFQFYFLAGLLGFNEIDMPSMISTVTGEDLDTSSP